MIRSPFAIGRRNGKNRVFSIQKGTPHKLNEIIRMYHLKSERTCCLCHADDKSFRFELSSYETPQKLRFFEFNYSKAVSAPQGGNRRPIKGSSKPVLSVQVWLFNEKLSCFLFILPIHVCANQYTYPLDSIRLPVYPLQNHTGYPNHRHPKQECKRPAEIAAAARLR